MENDNELLELLRLMTPKERAMVDVLIAGSDVQVQIVEALRTCTLEQLVSGSRD